MLTGWKDIVKYTGLSRNTIRRLKRDENFPLQYIADRPTTTKRLIESWMEKRITNLGKLNK
jgi:hypothetical protein